MRENRGWDIISRLKPAAPEITPEEADQKKSGWTPLSISILLLIGVVFFSWLIDALMISKQNEAIQQQQEIENFWLFSASAEFAVPYDNGAISGFRIIPSRVLREQPFAKAGVSKPLRMYPFGDSVCKFAYHYGFRPATAEEILVLAFSDPVIFKDVLWSATPTPNNSFAFVKDGRIVDGYVGDIPDDGKVVFVKL